MKRTFLYILFFLFAWGIFGACSSDKEGGDELPEPVPPVITKDTISCFLERDGKEKIVTTGFSSESDVVMPVNNWCKISREDVAGKISFRIKADENITNLYRVAEIKIKDKTTETYLSICQQAFIKLLTPVDNADYISRRYPQMSWDSVVTTENCYYRVAWREAQKEWTLSDTVKTEHWHPIEPCPAKTDYEWKVMAYSGDTEIGNSNIYHFKTGIQFYKEKEILTLEKNREGKAPAFVLLGDGFLMEDYEPGGPFDQAVARALDGLFKAEPFHSYRNYFNVYSVIAYSNERGVTVEGVQRKTTVFKTYIHANSNVVEADYNKVQSYAALIPDIEDSKNAVIVVIPNYDRYCGSTVFQMGGDASIAICGLSNTPKKGSFWTKFENVVAHEAGGHGFGHLCDEYLSGGNNIQQDKELLLSLRSQGDFMNVDVTDDPAVVSWVHFIGREGYDAVGIYEGGNTYSRGFYRSERNSCMLNNTFYFNAISREEIVKRILKAAGETYSFESFLKKDIVRSEPENEGALVLLRNTISLSLEEGSLLACPVWGK